MLAAIVDVADSTSLALDESVALFVASCLSRLMKRPDV
ncbi:hypothetical protein QFZ34_000357 [Phyllobacterium ifriqiyense]|uniref:DUF982 domain-containing protein n=1 Tax=Phyllobacterium ifriqiyense TaxID=314238 RepID=A0ABU0S341_9HYPH|nr:hypothetical protein [Phyllobacterium ifriqiyense]